MMVVEETGESDCIILCISIIGSKVLPAAKGKRHAKQGWLGGRSLHHERRRACAK